MLPNPLSSRLLLAGMLAGGLSAASGATVSVDPNPLSRAFDQFNDGIDTAYGFNNMSSLGEAGGVASVQIPPGASDPQALYPAQGGPFDPATYPYFRVHSRATVAGDHQVFPLPPSAATVVGFGNSVGSFAEAQLAFITPGPDGTGLRFDPIAGGTGTTEIFDYDYVFLDRVRTVGLGEFDRDGGLDGWTPNQITGGIVTAATSAFLGTTSGVDPTLTKGAFSYDTGIYSGFEMRIAVDPLSTSRFEVFWGTDSNPGPIGGQSVVLMNDLIRDGQFHTYRVDMRDEAAWAGNLNVLRLDPLADGDAAAERTFGIEYVRLIDMAQVPEPGVASFLALAGLAFAAGRRRRRHLRR